MAEANTLRVMLELGPKGKRVVAVAPDWPGLERGAKTEEAVLARLDDYRSRYARVADRAGLADEFAGVGPATVIERFPGTGSTDFWGISFAFADHDQAPVTDAELERELALLAACWADFDANRARVSAELRKGPRGGGRDREHIARHVILCEQDWASGIGVVAPEGATEGPALQTYRTDFLNAIREYHAAGKMAKKWPLRYLIRHAAFHTMDHAWEMEDKDLTGSEPA